MQATLPAQSVPQRFQQLPPSKPTWLCFGSVDVPKTFPRASLSLSKDFHAEFPIQASIRLTKSPKAFRQAEQEIEEQPTFDRIVSGCSSNALNRQAQTSGVHVSCPVFFGPIQSDRPVSTAKGRPWQ